MYIIEWDSFLNANLNIRGVLSNEHEKHEKKTQGCTMTNHLD